MSRLVVTGGIVLTGPSWAPASLDLLVEDGIVAAVDVPGSFDALDAARHHATDRLVVPGFVNGHMHSHSLVARGDAREWTLEASLLNGGWMAAARSEELAELCALLTAAELIASGFTGAFDLLAQTGGPSPEGLWAAARGYDRAGLRVVLAPMVSDRSVHEAVPVIGSCVGVPATGLSAAEITALCATYVEQFPPLPHVAPALAPTIAAHCTPELTASLHALAVSHGLRLHTHLAESKPQAIAGASLFGHSITAELAARGVLDSRLTVAHAIWLDDDDRALLASAGAAAVTVPGSNLRLGSGIADVRALLAAGVPVGIGTDGANSASGFDALDTARLTAYLSRVTSRPASEWLTVSEALDAATIGGALACGWSDVGRIAPGYAADLAFLDLGSSAFLPHSSSSGDLANLLLTSADEKDVTDTMVAGRFVYRGRSLVGIDLPTATSRFAEFAEELRARTAAERKQAAAQVGATNDALAEMRARQWPVQRFVP